MRLTPILVGAVCLLGWLVANLWPIRSHADNLAGAIVIMYGTGLALLIVVVCCLEQVIVAHTRPGLVYLLKVEGALMALIAWLIFTIA